MEGKQPQSTLFRSFLDISYSKLSCLNTVDLHFPAKPPPVSQDFELWLIYIHGGAFRDPLVTARSILPTLPLIFDPSSFYHQPLIHGVASINYRLSPHPHHESNPSQPGDPARSSKWPDYLDDVTAGIRWVLEHGDSSLGDRNGAPMNEESAGKAKRQYVLAGHSVGGTLPMMIAQSIQSTLPLPLAIVPLCGVYNFTTLRDAHMENRALYEAFTTAAFGLEEDGGWEIGNCTGKMIREDVKVVVMGHGKSDKLVDWGQCEEMRDTLDDVNALKEGRKAVVLEMEGDHNDSWKEGKEVARCVDKAIGLLKEIGCL